MGGVSRLCEERGDLQPFKDNSKKSFKGSLCSFGGRTQHNFTLFYFVYMWRTLPPNTDLGTWFSSLFIQFWRDFWVFLLHHYISAPLIRRPGRKKRLSPTPDMKQRETIFSRSIEATQCKKKTKKKNRSVCESVSVPLCVPEVKRGNLSPNAWRILLAMGTEELLGNISLSFQHLLSVSSSHSI